MDNEVTLDHADDEIAASWAEISARMEDSAETPAAKEAPAAVVAEPNAETPTEPTAAERARDKTGKFAKAEPVAAETPATPAEPVKGQRDVNLPPSSWAPAAKTAYAALSPELKAEIHRRESDFLAGQSQLLPDAQLGRQMKSIAAPYQALMATENATIDQALGAYLRQAATLRTGTMEQKASMIALGIKQHGISLDAINAALEGKTPPAAAPAQQEFRDPRFDQYLAEQEQRETQQIVSVIDRWTAEVDAQGQPLRPFAANVMADMIARVPSVKAANQGISHEQALTKAYEDAVWANPETRQLKLNELEAKRREESLRTVNDAKKAASVNVPRRGAPPAAAPVAAFGTPEADEAIKNTARELGLIS